MNTYILLKKIALFYNKKICDFLPFKQLFFFWNSSYVRNEIIIKFRPQALRLNLLCYQYPGPPFNKENGDKPLNTLPMWLRFALTKQRFYVDDLIADSSLLRTIKSFGGDTLRRITLANPCVDTISISRIGDTLRSEDYLWMVLHINNDTNVIVGCYTLLFYHFNLVEIAQPNFYFYYDRIPNDEYFEAQNNYDFGAIGITRAWDFSVGNENVLIGVIDDGIDWRHCEFATPTIDRNYKIAYGYTWDRYFEHYNDDPNGYGNLYGYGDATGGHGTAVCGIIGALTNRQCSTGFSGMAGIAGGWGNPENPNQGPIGCKLYVYRALVKIGNTKYTPEDNVIGSIRELAAKSPNSEYGEGVHIINIAIGYEPNLGVISEGLRSAVNYAYSHGVSIACSRGNTNNQPEDRIKPHLPATITPQNWVINVGGSNVTPGLLDYKNRATGSKFDLNMDFLAPNYAHYSTSLDNTYQNPFGGTSAAVSFASGVLGLLRSYCLEKGWHDLEPEDFEGMIKASCLDRNPVNNNDPNDELRYLYQFGYDKPSGWGHLQADNLFEMLQRGYNITHYAINFYEWTDKQKIRLNRVKDCNFLFVKEAQPANRYDPPETDLYIGDVWEYRGSFNLPSDKWIIDEQNKLFIWGRSGSANRPGGYPEPEPSPPNLSSVSPFLPIYWTGFTKVISGSGGNGLVEGIIHDHSLTVRFSIYQYHVQKVGETQKKYYPETQDLCAYISVFGLERKETPNVINSGIINNQLNAFVSQDIETSNTTLFFNLNETSEVKIYVYNLLGNIVLDLGREIYPLGINTKIIKTDNLEQGIYFIKIISNGITQIVKFVVVK